jgi:hypothetical protein
LPILAGMVPTRLLELRSINLSDIQSPISTGIVPVILASEMISLLRD